MTQKLTKTEKKQIAETIRREMFPLMGRMAREKDMQVRAPRAFHQLLRIADELTWDLLGLHKSFWTLLQDWDMNKYRPTMREDIDPRYGVLADLYDFFQAYRGQDVVAFRG